MKNKEIDNQYEQKLAAAKKLHKKARNLRGKFLNSVAVIERDIAIILTEYFCTTDENKQKLFFLKVAGKMSLEQKKLVLIEIVKNDYPSYWEQQKQFLNDLRNIQEFRNKLAHSVLDVSDEALLRPLEDGIGFVQWKEGKPITDSQFNDWVVKANMISSTLSDIKHLLPYKKLPSA